MTLPAFLLVLFAAVLHALWNLAAKKASGNIGLFWLGLCFVSVLMMPFAVSLALDGLNLAGLPYVVATSLIHTAYFGLLASSYRHGEMSIVYPLARGSGVGGTALVAWLFLGESVSLLGAFGIACVLTGMLFLSLPELLRRARLHSCVLALLVGLTIVGYSVVDKLGVGLIHPVVYIAGLATGASLFLAPWALLRHGDECWDAWANRKGQSVVVGLGVVLTYLLVLFAFQMGSVSYVVAVRELSIVVVVVLSVTVLQEPLTLLRGLSTLAILLGVVLVKLA